MDTICPKSPIVWDGNGFSECFDDMVLGFGANMVTVVALAALALVKRHAGRPPKTRIGLLGKVFLQIIPILGACLSSYEMILLLKNKLEGHHIECHKWFLPCSQFVLWMSILLVSWLNYWFLVLCNPFLCFWWIVKPFLGIPHLQAVISSLEVKACLKESSSVLAEFMFALYVNMTRAMHNSTLKRKSDSLEDPLISCDDSDADDSHVTGLERKIDSCWDILTFNFVNVMMNLGVSKQLDLEDLVPLPSELQPSDCHATLLRCWTAEQHKHHTHPSLFRAICYAYGWPYLRLGILKALKK